MNRLKWYPEAKACKRKTKRGINEKKKNKAVTTRSRRSEILVSKRLRIVRERRTKLCWDGIKQSRGLYGSWPEKKGIRIG